MVLKEIVLISHLLFIVCHNYYLLEIGLALLNCTAYGKDCIVVTSKVNAHVLLVSFPQLFLFFVRLVSINVLKSRERIFVFVVEASDEIVHELKTVVRLSTLWWVKFIFAFNREVGCN